MESSIICRSLLCLALFTLHRQGTFVIIRNRLHHHRSMTLKFALVATQTVALKHLDMKAVFSSRVPKTPRKWMSEYTRIYLIWNMIWNMKKKNLNKNIFQKHCFDILLCYKINWFYYHMCQATIKAFYIYTHRLICKNKLSVRYPNVYMKLGVCTYCCVYFVADMMLLFVSVHMIVMNKRAKC